MYGLEKWNAIFLIGFNYSWEFGEYKHIYIYKCLYALYNL